MQDFSLFIVLYLFISYLCTALIIINLKTFEELGVSEEIRRAIEELGFEHPMPVQEEVIPYLLGNRNDVIALAQTGTGKTAAFGIPVLQRTDSRVRQTQALVLSPTRELCLQIADDLKDFAKYMDGINVVAVYGGTSIENQIKALRHGAQIIVATPGRLIDLMHRGTAKLDAVRNVVLDEADEMLNMGFSESIDEILEGVPENRNTLLFSATMSNEIEKIARNYLHDPKEIVVGSRNEGAEHVNHIYYMVNAKDKYLALKRIVDYYPKNIRNNLLPHQTRDAGDCRQADTRRLQRRGSARRPVAAAARHNHAEVPPAHDSAACRHRRGCPRTRR